jgi:hypothetical protein
MLTFTMLPLAASSIRGTTARAMKKGPFTLVSTTIFQTSGSVSQKEGGTTAHANLGVIPHTQSASVGIVSGVEAIHRGR